MNSKNFLFAFLALIFTLTIFPIPVSATTNVTVTSPNGAEVWGGTHNITWDFNDTTGSQDIDFNLWYSNPSGANNFVIAQNLPFEDYCSVSTLSQWDTSDKNFLVGLSSYTTSSGTVNNVSIATIGSTNYLLVSRQSATVSNRHALYDWNGTSWVATTITFADTNSQTWQNSSGAGINVSYSIYEKNGVLYLIAVGNVRSDATHYYFTYGAWYYSGGNFYYTSTETSGLDTSTSIDKDVCTVGVPRMFSAKIGSDYYLISTHNSQGSGCSNKFIGQIWNGSNWTRYTPIETFDSYNFGTGLTTFSPFSYNGNTYAFTEGINLSPVIYLWSGVSGWQINNDLNNNLGFTTGNDRTINAFTISNNLYFLKSENVMANYADTSNTFSFNLTKMFTTGSYNTNRAQSLNNCSYSWNTTTANNGSWFVDAKAVGSTTATDSSNSAFTVLNYSNSSTSLPITRIQNISGVSYDSNIISLSIISDYADTVWKVSNNTGGTANVTYSLINSLTSGSQYFVYTSTDGVSWTFSDTLTFGSTNSNPVQKIWDSSTSKYTYRLYDSLSNSQTKYYKLVFQPVAKYWEVINSSSDWLNQNAPTNWRDSSGKNFDLFADSNYSNVQSYTVPQFQNLVSGDFTVGYELQFTAYATSAGNLSVGYRLNGSDTVATVAVTTSAKRFSVPIAPTARESNLIIKSTNTASNSFFLTDYAIVPRSYFVGQLEVKNSDYSNLQAILRNGVSSQYVLEGEPVRVQTSFYDTEGDLIEYEVQTLIGSVVVKDQFFSLTGSSAGSVFTVNQLIDGVIDLNGIGGELTTSDPLRSITYKVILHNSSDENVSEQYKTVSILQYPYFPNDLRMQAEVLNTKLGTNPKVRVSLNQRVAENFLGLVFAFYDTTHSLTTPNYSKTIYANQLGCTTLSSCAKEINFDEYVWEGTTTTNFTVQVTALLSTENKNYTDAFANVTKHVVVTPSSYSLGQLIQYYERRYALLGSPYKSSEKVPLVLGLSDDTSKNLSNYVTPYFTLGIDINNDLIIDSNYVTKFYPDVFAYDETTGNNYWLWNQYLYDDSGNLLPDGNNVFFHAVVVDKRNTQGGETHIGFTPRCVRYPFDLNAPDANYLKGSVDFFGYVKFQYDLQWLYTGAGYVAGTYGLNGCKTYPSSIITWDGNYITINDSYTPSAKQNQALYCGQKYDNNTVIDQLGDDFECILFLKEDEEAIDGVHVQIGNENSDFSISNENKQYIDFTIPQSDILFVDLSQLIRNWNNTGSPQDMLTAWDVLSRFAEDTMHLFSTPLTPSDISSRYGLRWSQAIGGDANFNLYGDFNNSQFNKVVMFKVSGLSVINAQDYLTAEQLDSFDLTRFLSYSRENNLGVNPKKARITIYTNSSKPYKTIETTAPMIINESASTPQQVMYSDGNIAITTVPAQLGFHVISTMSSANQTKNSRLIANLLFNSIIKSNLKSNGVGGLQGTTDVINGFLFGKDASGKSNGLFNAPLTFISSPLNIVLIIIIVAFALVLTLMARNISNYFQKR